MVEFGSNFSKPSIKKLGLRFLGLFGSYSPQWIKCPFFKNKVGSRGKPQQNRTKSATAVQLGANLSDLRRPLNFREELYLRGKQGILNFRKTEKFNAEIAESSSAFYAGFLKKANFLGSFVSGIHSKIFTRIPPGKIGLRSLNKISITMPGSGRGLCI